MDVKVGDIVGSYEIVKIEESMRTLKSNAFMKEYLCKCVCGKIEKRTLKYLEKSKELKCEDCRRERKPLTDTQREVVSEYFLWAKKIISPLKRRYPSLEHDIDSAAMLGLVKAAIKYDPSKFYNTYSGFNNFAQYSIFSYITRHVWVVQRRKKLITNAEFDKLDNEEKEKKEISLKYLTKMERKIVEMYYLEDKTMEEIAEETSLTSKRVKYLKRRAILILRKKQNVYPTVE